MKNKKLRIIIIVFVALLLIIAAIIVDSFVGNPISKYIAKKSAERYVNDNYSDLDLVIDNPIYNFKIGSYMVNCYVENSKDTHFKIMCNKSGKVLYDNYESIINGLNTIIRISNDFNKYVENIIRDEFSYDYYILYCDVKIMDSNIFDLDEEFEINSFLNKSEGNKEIQIASYVYANRNDMNWENIIDKLNELDKFLQNKGIIADRITMMLEDKDENVYYTFGVHDITREMIESDNLKEQLVERYIVDGVMPQLMISKKTETTKETKGMVEFVPLLTNWDGKIYNEFVDFKPYFKYLDTHNLNIIEKMKYLDVQYNDDELNTSRLEYIGYYKLGTVLDIEMSYGDVPDKCVLTDFIINNDGTLKTNEKNAKEVELRFIDGVAAYKIKSYYENLNISSKGDIKGGEILRGIKLSCEFGKNKADYLFVFKTDAFDNCKENF